MRLDDIRQRFIEFLEKDIRDWEEAARFYEQNVESVRESGDLARARSGTEEAEKYRARIVEYRELIEQLRNGQ